MTRTLSFLIAASSIFALSHCADSTSFSQVDIDTNGEVSFEEFDAYMKREVFKTVDTNNDGMVDQNEWRAVNPKDPISKFRRVDTDADGLISREEADADFDREGSLRELFKKMDSDGNGGLSKAEIKDFQARMRAVEGDTELEKLSNAARS